MITIGVTGGIGSGKSMICQVLEHLGYPVFYSDVEAKKNMLNNLDLISKIVSVFGEESYIDKQLNRTFLAKKIFEDPKAKEQLNSIVHPTVFQSFETWKNKQQSKLVFNESALLFETGSYTRFDRVWLVLADEETRIKRLMLRDKLSKNESLNRINAQLLDTEKQKLTKYYIYNNELDLIVPQIFNLIQQTIEL
jgi:dephospho-CoA kinase